MRVLKLSRKNNFIVLKKKKNIGKKESKIAGFR